MANKHNAWDLAQMQSLPLKSKIAMTKQRIKQWIDAFGEDGAYVSFSGGKDSTVLLNIVWNEMGYKDVPAVFVDVPTQYPELKTFAKEFAGENLVIVKPKISFMQVCEKYGFPLISKEVSECVEGARKYMKKVLDTMNEQNESLDRQTDSTSTVTSTINSQDKENIVNFLITPLLKRTVEGVMTTNIANSVDFQNMNKKEIAQYSLK